MGLILSVDVGTTNLKAALVDEAGRIVGEPCSAAMKIEGDTSGRAEHDPAALKDALRARILKSMLLEVARKSKISGN